MFAKGRNLLQGMSNLIEHQTIVFLCVPKATIFGGGGLFLAHSSCGNAFHHHQSTMMFFLLTKNRVTYLSTDYFPVNNYHKELFTYFTVSRLFKLNVNKLKLHHSAFVCFEQKFRKFSIQIFLKLQTVWIICEWSN